MSLVPLGFIQPVKCTIVKCLGHFKLFVRFKSRCLTLKYTFKLFLFFNIKKELTELFNVRCLRLNVTKKKKKNQTLTST